MIKKEYRLRHGGRIREVKQTGQSYHNRWLALSKLAGEQVQSRFAFSVSRRIGNAVTRNRVKRLMRDAIRQALPRIRGQWDVLLIARSCAGKASYQDIERAVANLLQQGHLWVPSTEAPPDSDPVHTMDDGR